MRVKVQQVGKGQHPSEVVVQLDTVEGPERLVVDQRSIEAGALDVGYPVSKNNGYFLIELPRETLQGAWRVWVDKKVILGEALEKIA